MRRHLITSVIVVTVVSAGGASWSPPAWASDSSEEPPSAEAPLSPASTQSGPLDRPTEQLNQPTLPPSLPTSGPKLVPVLVPPQPRSPAYQLNWQYDVPLIVLAGIVGIGRSIRSYGAPAYCAVSGCDPNGLNALDRHYAGQYQPQWNRRGDLIIWGIEGASLATLLLDEGLKNGLSDVVVVAESTIVASVAAGIVSPMAGRPRPLVYGTTAPASVRENGTSGLSFFSGHAATAFGAAVSTFVTVHRLHPDDFWPYYVLLGGVAIASFEGYTRVLSGAHFPTDVIAGAAAGTMLGILIPAMHASPHHLALQPVTVSGGGGLAVVGRY